MGELACLHQLPLPPSVWSLLRASVSLCVDDVSDDSGDPVIVIHYNALVQFGKNVAKCVGQNWRKCERFMNESLSLFAYEHQMNHYRVDIVVCVLDQLGVPLTAGQWSQMKTFLKTQAIGRISRMPSQTSLQDEQQSSSRSRSRTPSSSISCLRQPASSRGLSGSASSSSQSTVAEQAQLRALVERLSSRNELLQNMLETKNVQVTQLRSDKRLLQQKCRRMAITNSKLEEKLAESKKNTLDSGDFSLARVKQRNPGKWSWLTPLGKINVAALWW